MNRVGMYRLLRKLDMLWFTLFLREVQYEKDRHNRAVKEIINKYDQDRYMEKNNE